MQLLNGFKLFFVFVCIAATTASAKSSDNGTFVPMDTSAVNIIAFEHNKVDIKITVSSNGCTSESQFEIDVLESYPLQIEVSRLEADNCLQWVPGGIQLIWKKADLGISPEDKIILVNQIIERTNPLSTIASGYDKDGLKAFCKATVRKGGNSFWSIQDEYALACEDEGNLVITCSENQYLCSEKINY
mgnify:FL=1